MNGLRSGGDSADAMTSMATNAVLEQQRRLAAEFGSTRGDQTAAAGSFERLLGEILTNIGWQGEQYKLLEALPHLEPIRSFTMLRHVLSRLDISLIPVERIYTGLSEIDLPCLLLDDPTNCRLLTLGPQGDFQAYDAKSGTRLKPDLRFLPRTIYLIKPSDPENDAGNKPSGGFVSYVLKQLRMPLVRIAGYSTAIHFLGLVLSLYVLLVYDNVIATDSLDTLAFLAMGALVVLGLELRLRHTRARGVAYLAARFDGVVSVHSLASVLNLPLPMTERAPLASQLARFRQFEIGRDLFAGNLASVLFDIPFTLLFVVALFLLGGPLGFVPIGFAAVILVVCVLNATIGTAHITRVSGDKQRSDALLFELMDKLRTIRNAAAENIWLTRYASSLASYQRSRFHSLQRDANLHTLTTALVVLAGIVTLSVGALRIMDGGLSRGELIVSMMLVWRVLLPIQIASLNIARLKQTLSTVRQINDLIRMGNERKSETPQAFARRLEGNIYAASVYLSLGTQTEPQLRSVNLKINAGEIVAIAGPNGSGKSTLLKVILGLYPQYGGTLRLDGHDLRQLDASEIRMAIGYASQQPSFFYGSVAANFRFAYPSATDEEIIESLAAVGVRLPHPALPHGLATRLSGSDAQSISQGLLCRLSIARALVKNPPIVLLDDPGNGLDHAGDVAFMGHLASLRGRSTVLLVTARPSHMRVADRVVEMRGGVVVADGTPEAIVPGILARLTTAA